MAELGRRLRRTAVRWLGMLLDIHDTPEALARGLGVGFFFGISFLWGLQIALAVLVSHLLRGNKMLAAALTAVSNPLTSLPIYVVCYWIGQLVVGGPDALPDLAKVRNLDGLLALGPRFFLTLLVGTTLVGLIGAIALYFSASRIFTILRRWHARRTAGGATAVR